MTALELLTVPVALAGLERLSVAGRAYLKWRGTRLITCPETRQPAAVGLDTKRAAATAVLGASRLGLKDCSLWPERQGCGQVCLRQIESAPAACLVRTILSRWYADKPCTFCGRPFGEIHWHDHKPGLLSPDGRTTGWGELRPEWIPAVLATHRPVCWDCHIAETFRRRFPERVVENPSRATPARGVTVASAGFSGFAAPPRASGSEPAEPLTCDDDDGF